MVTLRCIIVLLITLPGLLCAEMRDWRDTQGRTMHAELVRVEKGQATFRKADGMHYKFAVDKLSPSDQAYIRQSQNQPYIVKPTPRVSVPLLPETNLTRWLDRHLVSSDGRKVRKTRDSQLPTAKYIALYYSAKWCPPCRAFTPKLVNFYEQRRSTHTNFEIIFVSSDRDEDAMEEYMLEYSMPWPAIKHDDAKDREVKQFSGKGIPCLVIIDREGNVIEHTYVDGEYQGPTRVMRVLESLIDG